MMMMIVMMMVRGVEPIRVGHCKCIARIHKVLSIVLEAGLRVF